MKNAARGWRSSPVRPLRCPRTGHHDHVNSEEVTELIRELALVCEDSAIVSILNRLGIAPASATHGQKSVYNTFATPRASRHAHRQSNAAGSPCNRPRHR